MSFKKDAAVAATSIPAVFRSDGSWVSKDRIAARMNLDASASRALCCAAVISIYHGDGIRGHGGHSTPVSNEGLERYATFSPVAPCNPWGDGPIAAPAIARAEMIREGSQLRQESPR